MNVNPRLCARMVLEGVFSNLAFHRTRLPLAWKQMQPLLEQSESTPVRQLARDFPPGVIKMQQMPPVVLLNQLFFRRRETEYQALQILADHIDQFSGIIGLTFYFDVWKELVASRWDVFQGAMFHSARLAGLETSDGIPVQEVLDQKINGEGLTNMGLAVPPEMKAPMVAPLIEFARARIGTNTMIAVLSQDRSQTDLIVVSLLRLYSLLHVARWDHFAQGLRPVTVFGQPPKLNELKSLDSKGAWCVIDASGGLVNDNLWDGLVKYLKPALQFGLGPANELHGYPVVARLQDLGLNASAEPEPGPRIGIKLKPPSEDLETKPKRVRKRKPRTKATPKPDPEAKPKPEPKPDPQVEPVSEAKPVVIAEPEVEPLAISDPTPVAPPAPEPAAASQEAPPTLVSRTLRTRPKYSRVINHDHACRAYQVAATAMEATIKQELHKGGYREPCRAALRIQFELAARSHYNQHLPPGSRPVQFLTAPMQDATNYPEVFALMRRLGLMK